MSFSVILDRILQWIVPSSMLRCFSRTTGLNAIKWLKIQNAPTRLIKRDDRNTSTVKCMVAWTKFKQSWWPSQAMLIYFPLIFCAFINWLYHWFQHQKVRIFIVFLFFIFSFALNLNISCTDRISKWITKLRKKESR